MRITVMSTCEVVAGLTEKNELVGVWLRAELTERFEFKSIN